MSTCGNCRRERPVQPYAYALGRRTVLLCDDCLIALTATGMTLRPNDRRVTVQAVAEDRRHPRPTWLARLVGRDQTGEVHAA